MDYREQILTILHTTPESRVTIRCAGVRYWPGAICHCGVAGSRTYYATERCLSCEGERPNNCL